MFFFTEDNTIPNNINMEKMIPRYIDCQSSYTVKNKIK